MTATHGTKADRDALIAAVADARADWSNARERLMDEDNDGADFRRVDAAERAMNETAQALRAFDAANPAVLAAIKEAKEPERLDFLRRLRADEGLTQAQTDELAALEAKLPIWRSRAEAEKADREAAFWAEWTPQITAERKAAWNAGLEARGIRRDKPAPKGLNMYAVQVEQERQFGFSFEALKRALAKHNAK